MFKRVIYDQWHDWVPFIAFAFTFAFFLVMAVRGLALKKDKAEHLAQLPLDDEPAKPQPENS